MTSKERRDLRKSFAGRPTDQELRNIQAAAQADLSLKTQEDNLVVQRAQYAMSWFSNQVNTEKIEAELYDKITAAAAECLIVMWGDTVKDILARKAPEVNEPALEAVK